MKEAQARDDLAVDFAGSLVKAKFFFAIKEYTKFRKNERELMSYKEEQADKLYQLSIITE